MDEAVQKVVEKLGSLSVDDQATTPEMSPRDPPAEAKGVRSAKSAQPVKAAPNAVQVYIKTVIGEVTPLSIERKTTVGQLKQMFSKARGIEVSRQLLIYRGRPLQDPQTLQSIEFSDGDTINIVIKLAARLKALGDYVRGMSSSDMQEQETSVRGIRKLLSSPTNPPIGDVINCGGIPGLVKCLRQTENATLQFEAAWALTNVASGSHEHTRYVVESGVMGDFLGMLQHSPNRDVKEQSVWALGNIAGDSIEYRDVVNSLGPLPLLSNFYRTAPLSAKRNIAWCVSNLVRGKPPPREDVALPTLTFTLQMLQACWDAGTKQFCGDTEIIADAFWSLSYLTDSFPRACKRVIAGFLPLVLRALVSGTSNMATPALRTLGNVASGPDEDTLAIVKLGAVPCAVRAIQEEMQGSSRSTRLKELFWLLSNVAAVDSPASQNALVQSGAADLVMKLLKSDVSQNAVQGAFPRKVLKEVWFIFTNALSSLAAGYRGHVTHWVEKGALDLVTKRIRKLSTSERLLASKLQPSDSKSELVRCADTLAHLLKAGKKLGKFEEYKAAVDAAGYPAIRESADAKTIIGRIMAGSPPGRKTFVQLETLYKGEEILFECERKAMESQKNAESKAAAAAGDSAADNRSAAPVAQRPKGSNNKQAISGGEAPGSE